MQWIVVDTGRGILFASIAIYADGDVCTGIVFLMFACMFAVPITGINEDSGSGLLG